MALLNAAEATDMTVVLFSVLWVKLASTRPDKGGNDPGTAGFLSVNFVFSTMYPSVAEDEALEATQIQKGMSSGSTL